MNDPQLRKPRFRFAGFVVSPSLRLLLKNDRPVPLIPRYFDLLLLLLERRNEALHRRDLLDSVWSDVVVSDGALSQAIRVLRRALEDDPRNPAFIRTVSRHGYRFIYSDVTQEPDEVALSGAESAPRQSEATEGSFEAAMATLLSPVADEQAQREAAEAVHAFGTEGALRRLGRGPGHARARALLRDSRWSVPGAGTVPILRQPGSLDAAWHLIAMRARRALHLSGSRWVSAVVGGAFSGLLAGVLGGVALRFGPGAAPLDSLLVTLPVLGLLLGALGAVGVGGGLAGAEAIVRSMRGPALVLCGAFGGWLVGSMTHLVGRLALQSLFGRDLSAVMGGFEGLVLGGAVGFGYALATPTVEGGMATPRGRARIVVAAIAGACCAVAAVGLAATGSYLGAMSLEFTARVFPGSDVGIGPLARLFGEARPGFVTQTVLSGWEGLMFGFGVVWGLTRRPH